MAIPKQGSRRIEVDGEAYLWRVRRRPTASQRSGLTPMLVSIASESGGATLIVRPHFFHPSNQVALCSQAVTPGQVADYVREARGAGWAPTNPGRPFELRPSARGRNALRTRPRGLRPRSPSELAALALTRPPEGRDTLRLVPDPVSESWPERGGVRSALIEINGVSLIELAGVAERPHAEREYAERAARGDAPDWNADDLAGNYFGMPFHRQRWPSRELFGEPGDTTSEVGVPADDPRRGKTTVLRCTCGFTECWSLLVSITVLEEVVIWSDFEQFHRPWIYDLGPFVFDRSAYLRALGAGDP